MRALALLLLVGCTTVEHERLVDRHPGLERCESGDLVARAYPGDWPNVLVEVREERLCATPIEEKFETRLERHVDRGVYTAIGAALGMAVGLALDIALANTVARDPSTHYGGRGDEWLALPMLGGAAGAAIVSAGGGAGTYEDLGRSVRVQTHVEQRNAEVDLETGVLATPGGAALGELRGGQATLPLELAVRAYGQPLELDGRPVSWSVRSSAWVPGQLLACTRAAKWKGRSLTEASTSELIDLEADAFLCSKDGWAFADELMTGAIRARQSKR